MTTMPSPAANTPTSAPRDGWQELRATLALAAPLAAANLIQMAVYAVDVIFVARLGQHVLSAASLGVALYGLLMWSMSGLVGAVAPLIAAELGQRRHAVRQVRRSVRMALWLSIASGILAMGVCAAAEPLMILTGQQPDIAAQSGQFLRILMLATIPSIMVNVLRVFVSALGRPGYAMAITILALIVNSLGNWLLVFGHAGFPAMGLQGSALSSVVTSLVMLAAYVGLIQADRRLRRYALFGNWWRPEWERLREIIALGVPIAATILAEGGLFSSAAFLMGRIGEAELAGHTVALQVASLAFQVPFGIAQAATIRVGLAYGAGDRLWIGRAGNAALALGAGFMAVSALLIWLFPRAILSAYVDVDAARNAAMIGFAVQYLAFAAAFQLFDGIQAVAAGALRGLQDTRVPMAIAIFSYWLPGFGTAALLGLYTGWRGSGVWAGLAVGLTIVSALLLWRWLRRERLGLLPPGPA